MSDKLRAAALAEPEPEQEQEPVAWYHNDFGVLEFSRHERVGWSPLYTAPPRREFFGLTHEERYLDDGRTDEEIEYAKAIEAKLKEKNGG